MDVESFVEPEVGVAVALTAALSSPSVRKTFRKGAVYGLAGVLLAGDAAGRFVRAVGTGAREAAHTTGEAVTNATGAPDETTAATTVESANHA